MQQQSIAQPQEHLKARGHMLGLLSQDFLSQTYNFGMPARAAAARTVGHLDQGHNFGAMYAAAYAAMAIDLAREYNFVAMPALRTMAMRDALRLSQPPQHSPAEDLALQLCRRWKLSDADASAMLGIGDGDARVRIDRSELRLRGRDQEDRVRHLLRIFEVLSQLLGDNPVYEREWLDTEMPILQGKSPMEIMRRGGFMDIASMADLANEAAGRY